MEKSAEEEILKLLQAKVAEGVRDRGRAEFDRKIGRPGTGWTSKFLAGREGIPTIPSLLRILFQLGIHPASFFAEALPDPIFETPEDDDSELDKPLTDAEVNEGLEAMTAMINRIRDHEQRIASLELEKKKPRGGG